MKKQFIVFLIISVFLLVPLDKVKATTLQDLYDELSALEESYSVAKNKAAMTQSELNAVRAKITEAENQITATQKEIESAEANIVQSEASIEEKKEQTDQMLLYLQLSDNESSYLEYLFEADNYTDFIYRYSIVAQLGEYNNNLMEELNKLIVDLQAEKETLANKQVELENQKQELQNQYTIIQVQYKDEQDDGIDIQDQIAQQKKLIQATEARCGTNRNVNINSCGGSAAAVSGWTYPVSSFYQSSIYGESRGSVRHYAVDLALSEGNSVYAVGNGTVKSVTTSTCGGMVIQILHEYNGTAYRSLYMHLLTGYVSTGDVVTGGQVIGLSGGGPQEIAKWGDRCTEGAHLHFAMSYGESAILSSSIKGSTFDPVVFFPAMSGYGATL